MNSVNFAEPLGKTLLLLLLVTLMAALSWQHSVEAAAVLAGKGEEKWQESVEVIRDSNADSPAITMDEPAHISAHLAAQPVHLLEQQLNEQFSSVEDPHLGSSHLHFGQPQDHHAHHHSGNQIVESLTKLAHVTYDSEPISHKPHEHDPLFQRVSHVEQKAAYRF